MSAGSAGSQRRSSGRGGSGSRHGPSRSSSQRSSYEERCVDPVDDTAFSHEAKPVHRAQPKDPGGKESETIGFIPGSADPASGTQTCNPCAPPSRCRSLVCSVLTCGLYRVCQRSGFVPCLAPAESSPDEPEKVSLRAVKTGGKEEDDGADWLEDVCFAGVKVDRVERESLDPESKVLSYGVSAEGQTLPSHMSFHESMVLDDWEECDEDVDSLITKKLLELYSEYQIEELARCTSDSVFLKKSKAINQLINSLAEEHKLDEQEAECRLVRGIIRISTRKSSKKRPPVTRTERTERTLSDSGNDTMRDSSSFSYSNNNDYKSKPNIQISEVTSSDMCARELWRNNGGPTSSALTAFSPSHTETDSSGVPSSRTYVRT